MAKKKKAKILMHDYVRSLYLREVEPQLFNRWNYSHRWRDSIGGDRGMKAWEWMVKRLEQRWH